MRILLVNKFYWPKGGSERVLFDLAAAYEAAGHEVVPFSMQSNENEPTRWADHFAPGVRYEELRGVAAVRAAANVIYNREAKRRLAVLLDDARPDVAHLHNFHHQLSPSIVDALREARVPAVHTLHDAKLICPSYLLFTGGRVCERCLGGSFHHAIIHRCVRGSVAGSAVAALEMTIHRARRTLERGIMRFVAPSRFLAGRLAQAGVLGNRVRVIPNGVEPSSFPVAERAGEGFLYAGRLSPEKGVDTLLEAVARSTDLHLTVLGTGPQEEELRRWTAEHTAGRVVFAGHRPRAEVLERVRQSRALVMPSICYENAPLSALEAQASGVPVVASRLGGLPEIVREGQTGLLFEPGDATDLAERLTRLTRDPELAEELGRAGRRVIETEFTLSGQAEAMLELLEEVRSSISR